jgi:hypothetical protein
MISKYHLHICSVSLYSLRHAAALVKRYCREKWYFKNTYFFIVADDGFNASNKHRLSLLLWFESHIPNLLGLSDSQLRRRCGRENETSAHILCAVEALPSHRHANLGFLEPEDVQRISLGAIWNFSRATGLP